MSSGPRLRLGILVDTPVQPAWAADVLGRLDHSESVRLVAVVVGAGRGAVPAPRTWTRGRERSGWFLSFLWTLYEWIERRRSGEYREPLEPLDLRASLPDGLQRIVAPPDAAEIDLWVDFTANGPCASIRPAPLGTWRHGFGAGDGHTPPGFW